MNTQTYAHSRVDASVPRAATAPSSSLFATLEREMAAAARTCVEYVCVYIYNTYMYVCMYLYVYVYVYRYIDI